MDLKVKVILLMACFAYSLSLTASIEQETVATLSEQMIADTPTTPDDFERLQDKSIDAAPPSSTLPSNCPPCLGFGNETEIRIAYFYPASRRFRKVYSGFRLDYEIETTQKLRDNLHFWANVSWFPDSGDSIGENHHTSVDLVPISIGLKYMFCINTHTKLYIGAGPVYYFLNIKDKSSCLCIKEHANHQGWGGAFKTQLNWFFYKCNYLSVFADYLYLPLHGTDDSVHQVGGLKVGLGIGRHF